MFIVWGAIRRIAIISPILPLRLPGQRFAERAASCRCAPEAVALRPRDLGEVRMERRPAAPVGDAVVGEDVDAVAAGMEAMPPDALDHRDARPRGGGDAPGGSGGRGRAPEARATALREAARR